MSKLINIAIGMMLTTSAFASEKCATSEKQVAIIAEKVINTDVPNHLKGAVIIVRLADGTETSVPAEKFKVVPRKQQIIVGSGIVSSTHTQCTKETVIERLVKEEASKNRLSLSAGKGPKGGLSTSRSGDTVSVQTKTGVIGGAQYQRLLEDNVSVGGTVQTNKSVLIGIGVDF